MKTLEDFLDHKNNFTYEEVEDNFKEHLNDCYGSTNFAGMTIYGSDMKDIDPVMFRCGAADYSSEYYEEVGDLYYQKDDYDDAVDDFDTYESGLEEDNEASD